MTDPTRRPIWLAAQLATLLATLLAACTGEAPRKAPVGPWCRPLAEREKEPFPRRYPRVDGTEVVIPKAPGRIVSATVLTDAVLLAICEKERISALHEFSVNPLYSPVAVEAAPFRRHSGKADEILELDPDLVFVASFSRKETLNLYGRRGASVVAIDNFETIADVESNLRAIGWVIGRDAQAEGLVTDMERRLSVLAEGKPARQKWRILLWDEGITAGSGTLFDAIVGAVGAQNAVLPRAGHLTLKVEVVIELEPDALVVGCVPGGEQAALERLRQHPALRSLACVRKGRVLTVEAGVLTATSQHIVLAAERIAERLDAWGRP